MSGWPTNGFPPSPKGTGETGGGAPERRAIVPAGPRPQGGARPGLTMPSGLFFCVLGGAVASSTFSFLGPVFVGYGYVAARTMGGTRGRLLALAAALVPAVALSVPAGVSTAVAAVVSCLVALVVAEAAARGRLTPGTGCAVVACAAACSLAADSLLAAAQGTTVAAGVEAVLDLYASQLSDASMAAVAVMQQVRTIIALLWPTAYVLAALGSYLFAVVGVGLAVGRLDERPFSVPRLSEFDLPLWVVGALVASAAALAFGLTASGEIADGVLMVSANLVMALRFALAAQGLAVLSWLLRQRGVGSLGSALIGVVALYLEVQFVVMTIVGLVDIWANFRHLQRGARPDATGAAKQD